MAAACVFNLQSTVPKLVSAREKLLVIGGGMAGARAIEEIEARAPSRFAITMYAAEPYAVYNRILLSDVLAGAKNPEGIFLNSLSWFAERQIDLRIGEKIASIDCARKLVLTESGAAQSYDYLIIATGSLPLVPDIANVATPGVFVFRTIDDCRLIASYAKGRRRAAVIGGGLLGLEAARGLLGHNLKVTVVEVMPYLMAQQLDPESAALLARTMEAMGLEILFEKATERVLGNGAAQGLRFKDGTEIETDMVVISCGIRPNVRLAVEAGLRVERGIVCDDRMRTSDPAIYSVGECVEHRGRVYGLVAPLYEQARVLADNLTGSSPAAAYAGSKLSTRLKVMGVDLVSIGDGRAMGGEGHTVTRYVEPELGVYKKLVVSGGKLVGAILLGDTDAASTLIDAYEREIELPRRHSELLFSRAGAGDPNAAVEAMAESAVVCTCHQVRKSVLVEHIRAGAALDDLCAITRAGTGCGGCKSHLEAMMAAYGSDRADPAASYYVKAVPLDKPALVREIKRLELRSVSAVLSRLGIGVDDPESKPGLASLLKTIWGRGYVDERDARFINDRVHANIQNDGTFSVIPRIYGGVTSPAELRRIADAAEKYHARMIKITGGQRIDLLGVGKSDLPAIWRDLKMPSGHAYTKAFRTCKTCVGVEFCRYGVGDSTRLGIAIEKRFQGIETPHKMKFAASGCARNCAEATVKDVGVVAIEGGWQIHVGGAAGSRVRAADLLAAVKSQDEALKIMGRFIQYYRENARYAERCYAFVERVGIKRLREVLIDDSDGDADRLDREVEAAAAAYRDPWSEGAAPFEPTQFAEAIAVEGAASIRGNP